LKNLNLNLRRIDGRPYGAYKGIRGRYNFHDFILNIYHIQGDPFAAPSGIRILMPLENSGIPSEFYDTKIRAIALADYLLRKVGPGIISLSKPMGSGQSGVFSIVLPGPEVIERNTARIFNGQLDLRFQLGLPGDGRRVMADAAFELLAQDLPAALSEALYYANIDHKEMSEHVRCVELQELLRAELIKGNYVSFIAEGSVLPRRSGASQEPHLSAIPFNSPEEFKKVFIINGEPISGMAIPQGLTVITGGGYHGKSTLLKAIQAGVWNHIPGDGREKVVTLSAAVKIRSEDGRYVGGTDISGLIGNLPGGVDTHHFVTESASGSTSQATNFNEALCLGANLLLIDEDISAVNFLVCDSRMKALIPKEKEPITPLSVKIRDYISSGISFIMVIGACADYVDLADQILCLDNYVVRSIKTEVKPPKGAPLAIKTAASVRVDFKSIDGIGSLRTKGEKIKILGAGRLNFGDCETDLSFQDHIAEKGQLYAIATAISGIVRRNEDPVGLHKLLKEVQKGLEEGGPDSLADKVTSNLSTPRIYEIGAGLFRLRGMLSEF
jgi:predicted ABC-class ATPase